MSNKFINLNTSFITNAVTINHIYDFGKQVLDVQRYIIRDASKINKTKYESFPKEFFYRLRGFNLKPTLAKNGGTLFLNSDGWKHLRSRFEAEYLINNPNSDWNDFDSLADKHFNDLNERIKKYKVELQDSFFKEIQFLDKFRV